ncbi:MAG: hypothetical protein ACOCWL_04060 [Thermoguttaceae bacterium]
MPKKNEIMDLKGHTYGELLVLEFAGRRNKQTYWRCRCLACGSEREYAAGNLRMGYSTQCKGCPAKRRPRKRDRPGYLTWHRMTKRGPVCKRWHSFERFIADMGEPPPGKPYIVRKDSTKQYKPGNCVWSPVARATLLTHQGITMPLTAWAQGLNISRMGLYRRLKTMPLEQALTTPRREAKAQAG